MGHPILLIFMDINSLTQHILLGSGWILFGVFHSVLASAAWKTGVQKIAGKNFKWYRPLYSLLAFVQTGLLLWFQFTIESPLLWSYPGPWLYILVLPVLFAGLVIMGISIKKYFMDLSGIDVLLNIESDKSLQVGGMHRFVRHPLYLGTLLFVWGIALMFPLVAHFMAAAIITLYTLIGTRIEEKKLLLEYGEEYAAYSRKVPMIIPGKNLWRRRQGH